MMGSGDPIEVRSNEPRRVPIGTGTTVPQKGTVVPVPIHPVHGDSTTRSRIAELLGQVWMLVKIDHDDDQVQFAVIASRFRTR